MALEHPFGYSLIDFCIDKLEEYIRGDGTQSRATALAQLGTVNRGWNAANELLCEHVKSCPQAVSAPERQR